MGLDVYGHVVYGVKLEDPMLSIQCEHEAIKCTEGYVYHDGICVQGCKP